MDADSIEHELGAGILMHYLVGGALALPYAIFSLVSGARPPGDHLLPALVWGLATAILPWLVFYPAYGWGFFGKKAPEGTRPVLSPAILHSVYGLGLGIFLNVISRF